MVVPREERRATVGGYSGLPGSDRRPELSRAVDLAVRILSLHRVRNMG